MFLEFYEDLEIGRCENIGTYRFTAENIVAYARRYDPQPFHVSEEAAQKSHFGHLCASGWHTGAAWMGCFARFHHHLEATGTPRRGRWPALGPSPGFENLRWLRPVYVGDEVTYTATVASKRVLATRPDFGLATFEVEGRNQDGIPVFTFLGKVLVERFEPAG